jgi:hypothetical protein
MSDGVYKVLFLCTGAAFMTGARNLDNRINVFTKLPLRNIHKRLPGTKLPEIGRMDGSSSNRGRAS